MDATEWVDFMVGDTQTFADDVDYGEEALVVGRMFKQVEQKGVFVVRQLVCLMLKT